MARQHVSRWISAAPEDGSHRATSSARPPTRSDRPAGHIHDIGHQGRCGSSGAAVVRLERPPIRPCHRRLVRPYATPPTSIKACWGAAQPQDRERGEDVCALRNPGAIRQSTGRILRKNCTNRAGSSMILRKPSKSLIGGCGLQARLRICGVARFGCRCRTTC